MFNNFFSLSLVGVFFLLFGVNQIKSQELLYFCERYDGQEIGVSDRFTTGSLTVMVRLDSPIYHIDVSIQWDRLNCRTGKFEYSDSKNFTVDSKWTLYVF